MTIRSVGFFCYTGEGFAWKENIAIFNSAICGIDMFIPNFVFIKRFGH